MKRPDALAKLSGLCMANADALLLALQFLRRQRNRLLSGEQPDSSDQDAPEFGYAVDDLPESDEIVRRFKECGKFVKKHKLRTCFHPDQFVVLNSPRPDVVEKSVQELEYQAEVAEWIGADVINIHGGGAYGDKQKALADFARNLDRLSSRVRSRLTVENDDKTYTPSRSPADLQGDRSPAGLRCASPPLQPRWPERRTSHQEGAGDLESRTDVPHFQPD